MIGANASAYPYWLARSSPPNRLRMLCSAAAWVALLLVKDTPACELPGQILPRTERTIGIYEAPRSQTWAVLIGVNGYQKARGLKYSVADAEVLAGTLFGRVASVGDPHVLIMTDKALSKAHLPTFANITGLLTDFLKLPEPEDTVLLFFSGHGFRSEDGRIFMAPIDADPKRPEQTCVPLTLIREALGGCRASAKLCIIDACHAGGTKGEGTEATTKDFERELEKVAGVYTLASCQEQEESIEWDTKRQGLFSYWLNLGLRGAADADGDYTIHADELFRFVHGNVPAVARRMNHSQRPVRIIGPGVDGDPTLLKLWPETAPVTLRRLAELLHEQALSHKVQKLGVLEFTYRGRDAEVLGGPLGAFGLAASGELERILSEFSEREYALADQRQIQFGLQNKAIGDLGDPGTFDQLAKLVPGLDALVTGTFVPLKQPERLRFQCKLQRVPGGDILASFSGIILMDSDLFAMLPGQSVYIPQPPPRNRIIRAGFFPAPPDVDPGVVAGQVHPLLRSDFPYQLEIWSNGRAKPLYKDDSRPNELILGASVGEEFEIRIRNRSPKRVLVRLFVDGINTLFESDSDTDLKPGLMSSARYWVVEPGVQNGWLGWYLGTGPKARVRRFLFDERSNAVAVRLGFVDKISLITAAFYEEADRTMVAALERQAMPIYQRVRSDPLFQELTGRPASDSAGQGEDARQRPDRQPKPVDQTDSAGPTIPLPRDSPASVQPPPPRGTGSRTFLDDEASTSQEKVSASDDGRMVGGVAMGREVRQDVRVSAPVRCGRLIASVHLRYTDEKLLNGR